MVSLWLMDFKGIDQFRFFYPFKSLLGPPISVLPGFQHVALLPLNSRHLLQPSQFPMPNFSCNRRQSQLFTSSMDLLSFMFHRKGSCSPRRDVPWRHHILIGGHQLCPPPPGEIFLSSVFTLYDSSSIAPLPALSYTPTNILISLCIITRTKILNHSLLTSIWLSIYHCPNLFNDSLHFGLLSHSFVIC